MQIDISEIDVQVLHFSQRNYQNPFTGEIMNLRILSEADAERLLQDIGGWMAGSEDKLQDKHRGEEIESWIYHAKTHQMKNPSNPLKMDIRGMIGVTFIRKIRDDTYPFYVAYNGRVGNKFFLN